MIAMPNALECFLRLVANAFQFLRFFLNFGFFLFVFFYLLFVVGYFFPDSCLPFLYPASGQIQQLQFQIFFFAFDTCIT